MREMESLLVQEKAMMKNSRLAAYLLFFMVIAVVIFVRLRLLGVPLERDEGEYAYIGQLILHGVAPYGGAYTMKLPGTSLMYAFIMALFGQTINGIHIGFLIVNVITALLVFLLSRKIVGDEASAATAGGTYALLSLSPGMFGFAAHAAHFVAFFAVCETLALLYALKGEKLLLYLSAGFISGLAFIMKQPGFSFVLFGALCLIFRHVFQKPEIRLKKALRDLAFFSIGSAIPLLVVIVWAYFTGTFGAFWLWTVKYALKYVSKIPLSAAPYMLYSNFLSLSHGYRLLWMLSLLGLFLLVFQKLRVNRFYVVSFVFFSFLAVCPGFYFRPQYFVVLLPAASVLAGICVYSINSKVNTFSRSGFLRFAGFGIFTVAALASIFLNREYLFKIGPIALSEEVYNINPFPESEEVAKFIESRSVNADRIAVLGSEPEIYFYSKRRSATEDIYMYPLMGDQRYALPMQKEMVGKIERAKPKFIVFVSVHASWSEGPIPGGYVFGWAQNYIGRNYALVGALDIHRTTACTWAPRHHSILVFERKAI